MRAKTLMIGGFLVALAAPAMAAPIENEAEEIARIQAVLNDACTGFEKNDKEAGMSPLWNSPEFLVLDFTPPRSKSYSKLAEDNGGFIDMLDGKVTCKYLEIHPKLLSNDAAYSWSIMHFAARFKNGKAVDVTFRSTDVWRKIDSRWYSVHEHNSFPVDLFTGQADLQSKP